MALDRFIELLLSIYAFVIGVEMFAVVVGFIWRNLRYAGDQPHRNARDGYGAPGAAPTPQPRHAGVAAAHRGQIAR